MPVVVIDGGASNARAVAVGDDGRVLAAARGPAAAAGSVAAGREAEATTALTDALTTLLQGLDASAARGGLAPAGAGGVDATHRPWAHADIIAGLAGTARPDGAARARAAVVGAAARLGLRSRAVAVTTDVRLALEAVRPGTAGPASVILAGTGAVALAADGQGHWAQAGGYGRYLSDEGGGFWLGARALQAAGRAADGRATAAASLGRQALAAIGSPGLDALIEAAPALWATPSRVAALAPLVLRLAADGDPAAAHLVARAARHLADAALAARRRLGLPDAAPLGYGGGLLAASLAPADPAGACSPNPLPSALRVRLPAALAERTSPLAVPPAVGAACRWLAARTGQDAVRRLLAEATDVVTALG